MLTKKDIEELKEKLELKKSELTKELESFATEDKDLKHNWNAQYPKNDRGDKDEEADDATEYDQLVSLEQNLEVKLRDVSLALEKIKKGDKGKYGICENCGKIIEEKRLKAYPEARLCINCNSKK